jgi:tetratricopeptide (TPR) repeat protein
MKIYLVLIFSIISIYANAQLKQEFSSNEYSKDEQNSASLIKKIENSLFGSNPNFDNLSNQLESIISKTPSNYVNTFVKDGRKFTKFWDEAEIKQYAKIENTPVEHLQNVFPYAHYLLAIIKIERGLFEDAFSVLNSGLKLEPDQPMLLNELAFLYTNIGETTKDTSYFNQSNYLFQQAFSSRSYNTNSQKGRSLRGLGFNLIELGDFKNSLIYYEKSLEYEESKTARNEIRIIKDKLSDESINIYSRGSNLTKSDKVNTLEYYTEQANKLSKLIKEKIPNNYYYIWSMASDYLSGGIESYRKDDLFNYPLKYWEINQIDAGVAQIVNYLKGVSPDHYIEVNSIINVEQLMLTFHYVKQSNKYLSDNIFEQTFEHMTKKDKITLFFKVINR